MELLDALGCVMGGVIITALGLAVDHEPGDPRTACLELRGNLVPTHGPLETDAATATEHGLRTRPRETAGPCTASYRRQRTPRQRPTRPTSHPTGCGRTAAR